MSRLSLAETTAYFFCQIRGIVEASKTVGGKKMASVKLMTPQNKPPYFKLTANILVDGKVERRYSRFDLTPKN